LKYSAESKLGLVGMQRNVVSRFQYKPVSLYQNEPTSKGFAVDAALHGAAGGVILHGACSEIAGEQTFASDRSWPN
jgi:hypothetical protein